MEPIEIVFLGTASSAPTKERNLSAIAIRFEGEWLLFDCPEGCQQQLLKGSISYMRIHHIFLTHMHLDHVLGLPGLIATMQMHQRLHPLFIHVPQGWKNKALQIIRLAPKTNFDIEIKEMKKGIVLENKGYTISAVLLKHEIDCYGLIFKQEDKAGTFQREKAIALKIPEGPLWRRLQLGNKIKVEKKTFKPEQVMDYSKAKKGVKISYIVDTLPTRNYHAAIKESDILVHEATFSQKNVKRAKETMHSTALDAGIAAEKTKCHALYLTHFSSRHKNAQELENEARQAFGNVFVSKELERIKLEK
ncbi:ribonuclease Z [Candidatus Micrarchaeota archaeon]|nr:ribonuclease Z [Candidatus Micrarchaeota archaeon]MBU1930134.1 ribonuclease Z [Candidatus Micrarchaeota archaeon]